MTNDELRNSFYFIFRKSGAKPPARRGFSAYASESDIHNSSIVIRQSSLNEVSYEGEESKS